MKITFVIASNTSGGAERVISVLCNYFQEVGDTVTLINLDKESSFYEINNGVCVIKLAKKYPDIGTCLNTLKRQIKIMKALKIELQRISPDVVVPFLFNSEFPVILVSELLKIPCITSIRNSPDVYPTYQRLFRRCFYPRLAGIVLQSETVMKHRDFAKVHNKTVIMNPLKMQIVYERPNRIKGKVISVGRLNSQKNHELTINAISDLKREFPDLKLHIFGSGELEAELRKKAQQYSGDNGVIFHGSVSNAIVKNNDAQLFIMSSNFEGFPNALVEAMACHIPVICTNFDTGVAKELIGNDEYGYIFEVGKLDQLKLKIKEALTNFEETENKSDKAIELCEQLNYKNIGAQWKAFICDVIQ